MNYDGNTMMNLSWTDIRDAVEQEAVVLFPLGVLEEHGPHLCLGTDIFTAEVLCKHVAAALAEQGIRTLLAPPFYWGICQSTRGFIGSFSIRMETAKNLVLDILTSLHQFGFKNVYGINGHGDIEQNILFMTSFREARESTGINARYCFRSEVLHFYGLTGEEDHICPIPPQEITVSSAKAKDIHAGDIETAIINKFYGTCVHREILPELPAVAIEPDREMDWILGGKTAEMSEMGYAGDPSCYPNVDIDAHIADTTNRYVSAILKKMRNPASSSGERVRPYDQLRGGNS